MRVTPPSSETKVSFMMAYPSPAPEDRRRARGFRARRREVGTRAQEHANRGGGEGQGDLTTKPAPGRGAGQRRPSVVGTARPSGLVAVGVAAVLVRIHLLQVSVFANRTDCG